MLLFTGLQFRIKFAFLVPVIILFDVECGIIQVHCQKKVEKEKGYSVLRLKFMLFYLLD